MEVRDALFPRSLGEAREADAAQQKRTGEPSRPLRTQLTEDEAIRGILERIHARWKGAADPQRREPQEELEKTRTLATAAAKPPPDSGGSAEEAAEEVFVETVLLRPGGPPGRPTNPPVSVAASAPDPERTTQASADTEGEELEKTIILEAAKLRGKGKDGRRV
jgi:hypothetical protein